jgi:hypothetical protein
MTQPNVKFFGWALLAGCFLTGGAIAYGKAMEGHVERAAALPNQVKQRDEALDKLEAGGARGSSRQRARVQEEVQRPPSLRNKPLPSLPPKGEKVGEKRLEIKGCNLSLNYTYRNYYST